MTIKVGGIEFEINVDADGVTTATTRAVDDLQKLQDKLKATDPAAKKASDSLGNMGRKAGAAGIQIQQLVGQIQGGQNVFGALSAQAADLGIVLGAPLVGAVAGLGAAFAGILLPSLFDTEDKTQDLIDKLRELAEIQVLSAEEAKLLAQEEKNKKDEIYGTIQATEKQIAADKKALKSEQDRLTLIGQTQWARSRIGENIRELSQSIVEEEAKLKDLNNQYDKSKEALALYNSMIDGSIEQTNKQAEEINALISAFEAQADAIGKTDRQLAIKAATEKGATEAQLEAINTAFDAIEAEEARAEAVVEARKKAAQAIKEEIAQQKAYSSILDEIFAKEEARKAQKALEKEQASANLEAFKESLMSEQQLRAEAFNLEIEQLKEARDLKLITQAEYDQLEKDKAKQHADELIAIEKNKAVKEQSIEDAKNRAKIAALGGTFSALSSLMNTESRKLFEIGKAAAVANAIVNTFDAIQTARASAPPPLNYALAAAEAVAGAANVAGIMRTSFGSKSAGQSFQQGRLTTNTSQQQPQQRSVSIALTGSSFSGGDIRGLISAINEELGDGVTLSATGG